MWSIQLLGGLVARSEAREITRFRTHKAGSLLAYLAYHKDRPPRSREVLAEMLWPDADPEAGRHNLSAELTPLRRLLEAHGIAPGSIVQADRFTVCLNRAAVATDVEQFQDAVSQGMRASASDADRLPHLERAVELYGGPLLPGYYDDWISPEASRLSSLYLAALSTATPLLLASGATERAIEFANRALAEDALNEEATIALLRALVAAGQPGQALRAYHAYTQRLREELAERPSQALEGLVRDLLRQAHADVNPGGTAVNLASVTPRGREPGQPHHTQSRPAEQPAAPAATVHWLGALPLLPATRFVGRTADLARIGQMLAAPRTRLVTVTGAGGIGKTRLALELIAARVEAGGEEEAIVFVPLAHVQEPDHIYEAILGAMRAAVTQESDPLASLAEQLAPHRRVLLALDSFDHLAERGAPIIEQLLARTRAQLLITSRQRLRLALEEVYDLPPLAIAPAISAPEDLLEAPGIELFVDRAQSVLPGFQISPRNASAVAELCARLEGIPLAIELAAAKVGVLTPAQILAQVRNNRLDFLASRQRDAAAHQRTLRATMDWSYSLLPPEAQRFLALMSIFAGDWSLDAATAVSGASETCAVELLTLLRDASLISVTDPEHGLRFAQWETIRAYGRERLADSAEATAIKSRYIDYFLSIAEEAEPMLAGPDQALGLEQLESEHANLREALELSLGGLSSSGAPGSAEVPAADRGARLAAALGCFWEIRGYLTEGRYYLSRALDAGHCGNGAVRAKMLRAAGRLASRQSDYAAARRFHEQRLELSRALQDDGGVADALVEIGNVAHCQGDYATAEKDYEEAHRLFQQLAHRPGIAAALFQLGNLAIDRGANERARSLYEQSLALFRELGDRQSIADNLHQLGNVALDQADNHLARELYGQALAMRRELGDRRGAAWSVAVLGYVAHCEGDYDSAHARFTEGLAGFVDIGDRRGIAWAQHNMGNVAKKRGDYPEAASLYARSLQTKRDLGDTPGAAWSLYQLGLLAYEQGDPESKDRLEEALALFRDLGDRRGIGATLEALGYIALDEARFDAARRQFDDSHAIWSETGDRQAVASYLYALGELAMRQGDHVGAAAAHAESIAIRYDAGDAHGVARSLEAFARLRAVQRDDHAAATLLGATAALRERLRSPLPPNERAWHERLVEALRSTMGDGPFESARADGRNATEERAIAMATREMLRC